jgi:hypothetical protein
MNVKCGKCKRGHVSVNQVRACYGLSVGASGATKKTANKNQSRETARSSKPFIGHKKNGAGSSNTDEFYSATHGHRPQARFEPMSSAKCEWCKTLLPITGQHNCRA